METISVPNSEFCCKGKARDEAVAGGGGGGGQRNAAGSEALAVTTVHSCRGTKKTALLVPLRRAYRLLPGIIHYTQQASIILSRKYNARE